MNHNAWIDQACRLLAEVPTRTAQWHGIVGLDGFVDKIARVTATRASDGTRAFIPNIPAMAERIAQAAGKSTALELFITKTKLGGNGPIMANAMARFGLKLAYIGAVGDEGGEGVHPVFRPMAEHCEVFPVCEAAKTDAIEFDDGKLMFQQMVCLDGLDYQTILNKVGRDRLQALFEAADWVCLNHWASLPHMSDIWRQLQREVCPRLTPRKRFIFFDLADLVKRTPGDVAAALDLIGSFSPWYDSNLGLNERESESVCAALGLTFTERDPWKLAQARAETIRQRIRNTCVVVHALQYAAAATATESIVMDGPYTTKPLISTGAGDHFNAGFFLGRILGAELPVCVQLAVCSSGYYVQRADSPTPAKLAEFLLLFKQ